MTKIEIWEEFAKAAERLYQSDPSNVRYSIKYRHCNGNMVITVTDDQVRLQYETQYAHDVKKIEKLTSTFLRLMVFLKDIWKYCWQWINLGIFSIALDTIILQSEIVEIVDLSSPSNMDDPDVTVEVEDDDLGNTGDHPTNVINQNPNVVMSAYSTICTFLASYGWPTLFLTIFGVIMWSNFEPKLRKWLEKRRDENGSNFSDPELLAKRAEEMQRARQKMQEKASAIIQKEAERRKELEEKKRQERIEDYDALQSGRSSHATQRRLGQPDDAKPTDSKNKPRPKAAPLRSDYNPLTGSSSSSRYRPAPRRTGGG